MNLLIVDDHPVVRRGVREVLADAHPDALISEASNPDDARRFIEQERYDLVILDLLLPESGGLELLPDLLRGQPHPKVLVLSVCPSDQHALHALRLGAAGYLNKLSAPEELVAAIDQILAGHTYFSRETTETLLTFAHGQRPRLPHEILSTRELLILLLVASGLSTKEIAARLSISVKTVGTYRARISKKSGLSSAVDIACYAVRHHLMD